MIIRAIALGLFLAIVAGAASWMAWGGRYLTDDQVDGLRAMVLLRRFEQVRAQFPQADRAFFVSVHGRDVDDAFIRRFAETGWTVRPGSQYVRGTGTYLRIDTFQRPDDDTVEIGGEYQTGEKPDRRFKSRLRWHWDGWRIAGEEEAPISESEPRASEQPRPPSDQP